MKRGSFRLSEKVGHFAAPAEQPCSFGRQRWHAFGMRPLRISRGIANQGSGDPWLPAAIPPGLEMSFANRYRLVLE